MGLMGGFLSETIMTWNKTAPIIRRINLFQAVFVIIITMIISSIPYVDAGLF